LFFVLLRFFFNQFLSFNFSAWYSEEEDCLTCERGPVVDCSFKLINNLLTNIQT
jgi:hypothetical protein